MHYSKHTSVYAQGANKNETNFYKNECKILVTQTLTATQVHILEKCAPIQS